MSKYIRTQYKQYIFDDIREEEEEDMWSRMGLQAPEDEAEDDFDWVDILIRKEDVWAVSAWEGDTVIWVSNRSMAINMTEQQAILKFFGDNLDISE